MLGAILIDVGGTLWPDTWPRHPDDDRERVRRLQEAVPGLSEAEGWALVDILGDADHPAGDRQQTAELVGWAIARVSPGTPIPLGAVQAAMSLPPAGRVQAFPGARELLVGLKARGIRVVIASNVLWRDADAYRRDFEDVGLAEPVTAFVSSIDVGWRKPHPSFFAVALSAAGHPPHECAMVGDLERNDIVPARALGMLTIRVAIEQPPPAATVADYVCTSLGQVGEVLFAEVDGCRSRARPP
jgi:HAD superfamily hydrolase (TIGR01509 family)